MDLFILKLLLPIVKLFAGNAIDYDKLKIIVETKILMDRRRKPLSWKPQKENKNKNPLIATLLLNMLISLLLAIPIFFINNILLVGIILHTYLLFMLMMTLITDFSSVLLDTADNQIILPRPVNSKTLFVARLLHISVYLMQFTLSLTLLPSIAVYINFGIAAGLATVITLLLTAAIAVFFTYLLYLLLFYFFNEQKIKNIVTYFQIFMTVLILGSYQILPRLLSFENMSLNFTISPYAYAIPPVWMGMSMEAVYLNNYNSLHLIMIGCALVAPAITIWFMTKYLAPVFNKKMAALGSAVIQKSDLNKSKSSIKIVERLSAFFCKNSTQIAAFEKVWKITARDKNFKLQFYPSIGYIFVLLFVVLFKKDSNPQELLGGLKETKTFLLFIYLPVWMLYSSLHIIPFNQNFEGAWIYKSAPLKQPGQIILGSLKALFVKFFLPFFVVFFIMSLYIWGPSIIDDFIYGLLNSIFLMILITLLNDIYLPFSLKPDVKKQAGKVLKIIFQSIAVGVLIGLHYLVLKINYLQLLILPVWIFAIIILVKSLKNIGWNKINI